VPSLTNDGEIIFIEPPNEGENNFCSKGTFEDFKNKRKTVKRRVNNKASNKLPTSVTIRIKVSDKDLSQEQIDVLKALHYN
jgi:hypothetical protein